ncbi:aspartate kinase [Altibacter sp. HG106]|uniref:aspartate kinase n=1 Tax=Altibacter sp. HG106 TaxID=3023937 RepID=UPI00300F9F0E
MSVQLLNSQPSLIDLKSIRKRRVHLAIFGHGNVGAILIDQIISSKSEISRRRDIELTVFAIANSTRLILNEEGISENWRDEKKTKGQPYNIRDVINFSKSKNLSNVIAIDNTASSTFVSDYQTLVKHGFHLVSSNKIANTLAFDSYKSLRKLLFEKRKQYLYETNVGAGLPLVDTIQLLHLSGENITRIKGVFSGSLSYIFNTFSEGNLPFSEVLRQAISKGYTEPDPREDLCGNDVGRKLLILARELDLHNEFEDISIQNLIPENLRDIPNNEFMDRLEEFNVGFQIKRKNLGSNQVLRYVGDLHGDLSKVDGAKLQVSLVSVPKSSALGHLQGSDSIFEIYTENYGNHPIVIQGAGAGAAVTARGVLGDVLRLSERIV